MIRKWLKNIIKDTLIENFPPCNIVVEIPKETSCNLKIDNTNFNNSIIKVRNSDIININSCSINCPDDGSSFMQVEDN